ncbi:hypothetical protein KIN20_026852 [Parelaphostrongylus tenuis]|uniref:Uncharacterized protein n=1 Tax=Parelaphostrongylus tenuis TaxID=148309 RepID=A0AAD5QYK5_PARTN|nr:hypothetical protein KIN20_026852 [Parelaphostrongylus tenuis]
MESFDVTALYTDVSNECEMRGLCELLTEHKRFKDICVYPGRENNTMNDVTPELKQEETSG